MNGPRLMKGKEEWTLTTANASFQAIMDAAEALVQEKGCRTTTLQDIIERTGLSKGAIYHYVTGKDELLALVLKSRVERLNARFAEAVADPNASGLNHPLQLIAESLIRSMNRQDAGNQIFIYLLSRMDKPKVAEMVREVYDFTLRTCTQWIDIGKAHGVIPAETDSAAVAANLLIFMYGLRVQNTIWPERNRMSVQDLAAFMSRSLS